MLIWRKAPHRFIFIHVFKTGGTSIRMALIPHIDPFVNRTLGRLGLRRMSSQPYPPHTTASEIVALIGKEEFESYYSFGFVRNPWDWNASLYSYIVRSPEHEDYEQVRACGSFEEFLAWRCTGRVTLQKDFLYSKENEQMVDFIGRYERLEADFQQVCTAIGIRARLPHVNASKSRPYQDYYNRRTIEIVRQVFAEDIRLFNYEFGYTSCGSS